MSSRERTAAVASSGSRQLSPGPRISPAASSSGPPRPDLHRVFDHAKWAAETAPCPTAKPKLPVCDPTIGSCAFTPDRSDSVTSAFTTSRRILIAPSSIENNCCRAAPISRKPPFDAASATMRAISSFKASDMAPPTSRPVDLQSRQCPGPATSASISSRHDEPDLNACQAGAVLIRRCDQTQNRFYGLTRPPNEPAPRLGMAFGGPQLGGGRLVLKVQVRGIELAGFLQTFPVQNLQCRVV